MDVVTYRSCSAGETFDRVSPFLYRLGITRVARQTGLDKIGIPVWCAVQPNALAIVIAQGKGLDNEAARTSAVMEAVERSVATAPCCRVITSSRAVFEEKTIRHDRLDELLAAKTQPLAMDEALEWVAARHLLTGEEVWLPYDAVHLDRSLDHRRYWQSSDGLASGNHREEAILHGLLERIERDAHTLWQITPPNRRYARRLDPASLVLPELRIMVERIEQAGLEIAIFDMTSDLSLPAITALLAPRDRKALPVLRHVEVTLGCGAHAHPEVAVSRAVSEAVQSRMTFIAGARDDHLPQIFEQPASSDTLVAFDAVPSIALSSLPSFDAANTASALQAVLDRLSNRRIDRLYAVDLSPEWLPASVVKVIAPQLENPDGERRQRFGMRAISRALQ
ncbi:YcaO-like family protein (plasmid) [Peteryoungia desertarenae]|uniref:YcaO-like family protein n=1 Tax=Peteryoungia desertarenae TaxID=1813451 RepID=A0ABX6QUL5_9HYPH|nr:YcaO-like family protein [Peteryoungia desertarenae]QLF71957.1 YcaO-like family protein [Peteryoungia desertarenae]